MGPFNYTCQCVLGYTGPTCQDEIEADGCLIITCPINSVCVNESVCICPFGFELNGEMCQPTGSVNILILILIYC